MILKINLLDPKSVNDAYKTIKNYQKKLQKVMPFIAQRCAEKCVELARLNLIGAEGDSDVTGVAQSIHYEINGTQATIIASHKDAVFLEFGAGVFYNGGEPDVYVHTNGEAYSGIVPIGNYGMGLGRNETWIYNDGTKVHISSGTQCTEFMYKALQQLKIEIPSIVREFIK